MIEGYVRKKDCAKMGNAKNRRKRVKEFEVTQNGHRMDQVFLLPRRCFSEGNMVTGLGERVFFA